MIKYGISLNYISDWSFNDAYREIIQNFIDFGDYNINIKDDRVIVSNKFNPKDFNFLKIGFSSKKDSEKIGKHGEGLKMAMLVLHRLNIKCRITYQNIIITPKLYEDELLGECFGLNIEYVDGLYDNFSFTFEKVENFENFYSDFVLSKDDIIFECVYGRIVNKEIGNFYVGGLFITNVDNLSFAYDLNPNNVDLGRDRRIPSTFDVEYYCSMIYEIYIINKDLSLSEIQSNNRDFNYVATLPEKVCDSVIPYLDIDDDVYFEDNSGNRITNDKICDLLRKDSKIKEKITKIKYDLVEKKTPHSMIKFFNDRYKQYLPSEGKDELNHLQYESLNWKF
jgi:hypothetical protein